MKEINEIDMLTKLPEWIEVENRHKKKIAELSDLRTVDTKLSGDDLKIELRARELATEKLVDFLEENNFSRINPQEVAVTFE